MKVKIEDLTNVVRILPKELDGLDNNLVEKIADFVWKAAPYIREYDTALLLYQRDSNGRPANEIPNLLTKKMFDKTAAKEVDFEQIFTEDEARALCVKYKKIKVQELALLHPFSKPKKK